MEVRQKARGTTVALDAYTGPIGQLTVDVDRMELRLHDGVGAGGERILNKGQNDLLYHGIGTLTIADITNLQSTLDGKASLGANTFTGTQILSNTSPLWEWHETDGNTGYNRVRSVVAANVHDIQTRTDADVLVSVDRRTTRNASGALTHEWRIANVAKLLLNAAGLTVTGALTVNGTGALANISALTLASGDIFYVNGSNQIVKLAKGTDDEVLTLASGLPSWASSPKLGDGQTWQIMNGSRSGATTYQNTTGKPIMVTIEIEATATLRGLQWSADGSTWVNVGRVQWNESTQIITTLVPDGDYYRLSSGTYDVWSELR